MDLGKVPASLSGACNTEKGDREVFSCIPDSVRSNGATALVTGLVVVYYILDTLRPPVPEATATLSEIAACRPL